MRGQIKCWTKAIVGGLRCKLHRINTKGNHIYIGKKVKIAGGKRIWLEKGVSIRPFVECWCFGEAIHIGEGTDIGTRSRISISNSLEIGKDVLISPNVYITDCDHAYTNIEKPIMYQGIVKADNRVIINDNAYIGINAVIVGKVTIGRGSVIGANSVVTKDVPDYCVAVGAPARIIKRYNLERGIWEKV